MTIVAFATWPKIKIEADMFNFTSKTMLTPNAD